MKSVKAFPVTKDNFNAYGYIANISDPSGNYSLGDLPVAFYRDMTLMPMESQAPVAFGSLKIEKRPCIIEDVEYHSKTSEVMMPLDDDVVVYAGPASNDFIELEQLEAFIIPKGTLIVFRAGVWHGAPYPVNNNQSTVLICLPERTYINDTKKYILDKKDCIMITI